MAIRNADTAGREETCQPAPRAPPPANRSPFPSSQQRLGSDRELIRDVVLAGPSRLRDGEDQSNVGEINVLASRQTRRPQQTALTQSLTERAAGAVPGIGKDAAETRPLKHLKHETSANHQCAATTTPNLVNDDDDSAAHTGFALNARKVKKPVGRRQMPRIGVIDNRVVSLVTLRRRPRSDGFRKFGAGSWDRCVRK
jgi:hypothetical protein